MKFCKYFFLAAAMPLGLAAAELPAPATEVQIFRNGTALIRHQVTPGTASSFTVTGNFSPLEGTLWSSSNVKQIRKTLTEISRKEPIPFNDIISTWKNQRVTLRLACGNGKIEKISGTIIDLYKKETHDHWNQIVTLKCSNGNILAIRHNQIAGVESAALKVAERTVKETKQAWEFTLMPKAAGPVTFDYVSKVLNWTPAFKMTLLPEKKFFITGSATVVNSGDELKNVKCTFWFCTRKSHFYKSFVHQVSSLLIRNSHFFNFFKTFTQSFGSSVLTHNWSTNCGILMKFVYLFH